MLWMKKLNEISLSLSLIHIFHLSICFEGRTEFFFHTKDDFFHYCFRPLFFFFFPPFLSFWSVYVYGGYTRRKFVLCHYLSKWHFVLQKLIVKNNFFNPHWLDSKKSNKLLLFYYQFLVWKIKFITIYNLILYLMMKLLCLIASFKFLIW
jgi:hypothetical protein